MIKIKAKLKSNHIRKAPIYSGYRPLFKFIDDTMTSGQIQLLDRDELLSGEEAIVEISFLFKEHLGDNLFPGKIITFGEGFNVIGKIEIISVKEFE